MRFQFTEFNNLEPSIKERYKIPNIVEAFLELIDLDEQWEQQHAISFLQGIKKNPVANYFENLNLAWNSFAHEVHQNILNAEESKIEKYILYVFKNVKHFHLNVGKTINSAIWMGNDYLISSSQSDLIHKYIQKHYNDYRKLRDAFIDEFLNPVDKDNIDIYELYDGFDINVKDDYLLESSRVVDSAIEITHRQQYLLLHYLGIIKYIEDQFPHLKKNKTKLAKLIGYILDKTPDRSVLTYIDLPVKNIKGNNNCRTAENYRYLQSIFSELELADLMNRLVLDKGKDIKEN